MSRVARGGPVPVATVAHEVGVGGDGAGPLSDRTRGMPYGVSQTGYSVRFVTDPSLAEGSQTRSVPQPALLTV